MHKGRSADFDCAQYKFWDSSAVTTKPWSDYTNNPLSGKLVQKLVPQVREYIQEKLPDYMVPQAFVVAQCPTVDTQWEGGSPFPAFT